MVFTAPIWLLSLAPWLGVVLWLIWGRPRRTRVPFLQLWRGPALQPPVRSGPRPPPLFLTLALIGMLLALLACAGPTWKGGRLQPASVVVIVDRGLNMSTRWQGRPRFAVMGEKVAGALIESLPGETQIDVRTFPGAAAERIPLRGFAAYVTALPPTAVDTFPSVALAVREELANDSNQLVIVISNAALPFFDPRLVQPPSEFLYSNVGIVHFAARLHLKPQAMVRLRSDSAERTATLRIRGISPEISQRVELPPIGHEQDYFFDLNHPGQTLTAELDTHDDQAADNRAWLTLQGGHGAIEPQTALSPEVQKMVKLFNQMRPASAGADPVTITSDEPDSGSGGASIIVAPTTNEIAAGEVRASSSPILENVNASNFGNGVNGAGRPPIGWTPILTVGAAPIVAVREGPPRGVWIGFDPPTGFTGTTDFVVFWTNVFTWAAGEAEHYSAKPLSQWTNDYAPVDAPAGAEPGSWPGVYRSADGALAAFNAPTVSLGPNGLANPNPKAIPNAEAWHARLKSAVGRLHRRLPLDSWLLILAVMLAAASAWMWAGKDLTKEPPPA